MLPRLLMFVLLAMLAACAPTVAEATATPSPAPETTPTATTDWFPASATPSIVPTAIPSPTADMNPGLGEVILEDNFTSPSGWPSTETNRTRVAVENGRLNLFTDVPGALVLAPRNAPSVSDFYAQLSASPNLCEGEDEYGLMLRINSAGDHYRFALSCDGRARVERVLNGAVSVPLDWQAFPNVPSVAPSNVVLSVWASGSELRFFVDDALLFSTNDTVIYVGRVGAFIRARGEGPLTVSFSDLSIRELVE